MKTSLALLTVSLCAVSAPAHAQVRTSADYAIIADGLDYGGQAAVSQDYAQDGSAGPVTGVSREETTETVAKHGYIGQLYEVLGFGIRFTENYPAEGGTSQVIPLRTLDDGTHLPVPLSEAVYTVIEGPVAGISPTGLITTLSVYQETPALIRARLLADDTFIAELSLFVQDTSPDNFGGYAGDGLPDSWQFDFFGADSPLAGPAADADQDGFNNRFEYDAGIDPLDATSGFLFEPDAAPALPAGRSFRFRPRLPGHRYRLESNAGLNPDGWVPVNGVLTADDGETRTLTDLAPHADRGFYRLTIRRE